MKKKILSGLFALALLATAGYGVNKSTKSNVNLSDLALANVEALANNEGPGIGEPGEDYKYVVLFEIGRENICVNGNVIRIVTYGSDCYFDGSLTCPGVHHNIIDPGLYCI